MNFFLKETLSFACNIAESCLT